MNSESCKNRNYTGPVILSLITGLAIGAVAGILFAPKPGDQTRKELKQKGDKFIQLSRESFDEILEKTRDFTQSGKQKIEELKVAGEDILDTGRKKVKEASTKIKKIISESKKAAAKTEEYLS
jgi:gas vesicle protein